MHINFLNKIINFLNIIFICNYYDFIYILLLTLFLIVFTIIIPNKIKYINYKKFVNSIKIGDEILTSGGLICKVYKSLNNNYFLVIINNNQKVLISKDYIRSKLPNGTLDNLN
ncbi:preprotein translocase subunit YajC [endosymbiont of Pachyrhynchus infernalis]|uniref:preprotein translocase subunit YajC n=1 Tax=endosymbiont of Pachyrhynchus infernalis TaxID=1971488 RepID=UPI000DC731EA|nr:preprotein translocase subunit YajC [endosymbiont of Pachyrhynchus infernalis]BBA84919.1 membrane protein [endosymbiont of Pachyrhynchus infernalis]